jgi:hypothetical protein
MAERKAAQLARRAVFELAERREGGSHARANPRWQRIAALAAAAASTPMMEGGGGCEGGGAQDRELWAAQMQEMGRRGNLDWGALERRASSLPTLLRLLAVPSLRERACRSICRVAQRCSPAAAAAEADEESGATWIAELEGLRLRTLRGRAEAWGVGEEEVAAVAAGRAGAGCERAMLIEMITAQAEEAEGALEQHAPALARALGGLLASPEPRARSCGALGVAELAPRHAAVRRCLYHAAAAPTPSGTTPALPPPPPPSAAGVARWVSGSDENMMP